MKRPKSPTIARGRAVTLGACALLLVAFDGVAVAANSTDEVCRRWVCDRADMSEGVSTGNVTSCDPGDLLPPGRPNALKLVNLYRFLTGMPAVTEDPTFDTNAQDCAVIQAANGLSHTPTSTDACYNATGATASNRSSICGGQAVGCIDLYMDDSANATGPNFGHRTWILANSLGPVGFGSVGSGGRTMTASCFYQVGGTGKAGVVYVAWPPGGPVPLQAFTATELDKSGWSLQSDTINLGAATATVMDGTTSKPVTVSTNLGSYGAKYAMGITPNGWTSLAGHNYVVTIGGTTTPISYTVQVVDCVDHHDQQLRRERRRREHDGDGRHDHDGHRRRDHDRHRRLIEHDGHGRREPDGDRRHEHRRCRRGADDFTRERLLVRHRRGVARPARLRGAPASGAGPAPSQVALALVRDRAQRLRRYSTSAS